MTKLRKNIFLYIRRVYGKNGEFGVGKYMLLNAMIFLSVGK